MRHGGPMGFSLSSLFGVICSKGHDDPDQRLSEIQQDIPQCRRTVLHYPSTVVFGAGVIDSGFEAGESK